MALLVMRVAFLHVVKIKFLVPLNTKKSVVLKQISLQNIRGRERLTVLEIIHRKEKK